MNKILNFATSLIQPVDYFLNKMTTYRAMLYYLLVLVGFSIVLGFFKLAPYTPVNIILSLSIATIIGFIANLILAKLFKAVTNIESVFITVLILILIMPIKFPENLPFVIVGTLIAISSKYILAINKRHIFNPAAISLVIMSYVLGQGGSWWISSVSYILPVIIVGGVLIIRKTRRESLIVNFLILYFLIIASGVFYQTRSFDSGLSALKFSLFDPALFFFAFVMLIEPLTTPATRKLQIYYAYIVALVFAIPQIGLLPFALTAEMSLAIGNIFNFIVNRNYRFYSELKNKIKLAPDTYQFTFSKSKDFNFLPGQYMEWTLPHKKADSRGNRRYFSLSSSPSENEIAITVKFYNPSSSYKKELLDLKEGKKIMVAQVAGDFILPKNINSPLVFIAGGVGITPFRSMIQYLIDKNLTTDIVLFYTNREKEDIVFADVLEKAKKVGVKTVFLLTDLKQIPKDWKGKTGYVNEDVIKDEVKDYKKRLFYISGPQLMVENLEKVILGMGVSKRNIKTDFFPGYSENK